MAYTAINDPTIYMNTVLYTGTGSSNAVTGVGFQPDFTWIKNRETGYSHQLYDVLRGTTERIFSNVTNVEETDAQALNAFGADGFTVGTNVGVNENTKGQVSWNWKAGTSSGLTGGTITPSYSYNATSGFGIYQWTGTGAAGTITHGLGSTPKMIIVKVYNYDENWIVYDSTNGATNFLRFNDTHATGTNSTMFDDTEPTSTVFTIGSHDAVNKSTYNCIAYVFADVAGYSKFGSYTGNGRTDGTFVYTGFRPAWVVYKPSSAVDNWEMLDNKRDIFNPNDTLLYVNLLNTESDPSSTNDRVDFLSNGFKFRDGGGASNGSGTTYIYMAFAEAPFVNSEGVPCNAR